MAQKVTSDEEIYLAAAASNGNGTDTSGDYFETSESEFENIINCQPVKRNEALAAYARQRILSNSTELSKNLSFMTSSSDDEGDADSFDEQNNISVLPMNFDESLTPHFNDSERTNPADKTPKQVPALQTTDREQKSIKSIKNTVRAKHNILKSLEESKTVLVRQFNVVASDAKETEDEQLTVLERKGRQVPISAITSDIDYCDLEETDVSVVALQQQSGRSITVCVESECEANSCYEVKESASTHSGNVSPNVIDRRRYENAQQIEDDKSEMNRKSREKLMQFKLNLLKWKESQNLANSSSSQEEESSEENIKGDDSDVEYDVNDDKEEYVAESYDEEAEYENESLISEVENEADLLEYGSYSTDSTSAEYTTSATDDNSTDYTDAEVTDDSSPCTSYAKNDMIRNRMQTIIRSAKPSESEQLIRLEEANKSQTDLKGKNLSKARIPVPPRFPAVRPFRNRSFTDLQMREIARENNILARKLVALKPKKYNNAYQHMVPRKIIAPSLTTRKKQQQQIDFENNILKGKLMAIGRRKPLF